MASIKPSTTTLPPPNPYGTDLFRHTQTKFGIVRKPPSHAADDYDFLVGGWGSSGAGYNSCGLALYKVKVTGQTPPRWQCMAGWPYYLPGTFDPSPADYWNHIQRRVAVAWVQSTIGGIDKEVVIATGTDGVGFIWYGYGDGTDSDGNPVIDPSTGQQPSDPDQGGQNTGIKGYRCTEYQTKIWLFNPNEVNDPNTVKVSPIEEIDLTPYIQDLENHDGSTSDLALRTTASIQINSTFTRMNLAYSKGHKQSPFARGALFLEF